MNNVSARFFFAFLILYFVVFVVLTKLSFILHLVRGEYIVMLFFYLIHQTLEKKHFLINDFFYNKNYTLISANIIIYIFIFFDILYFSLRILLFF